jgi:hypothetical protein
MSVAFTKEDSAETASETPLPDRPISPHPNLVTEAGLAIGRAPALLSSRGRVKRRSDEFFDQTDWRSVAKRHVEHEAGSSN